MPSTKQPSPMGRHKSSYVSFIAAVSAGAISYAIPSANAATTGSLPLSVPHDLSPWGMFLAADIVVKAVMIGLVLASVLVWTVWLAKSVELLAATRRLRRSAQLLAKASSLDEISMGNAQVRGLAADGIFAAREEVQLSAGIEDIAGIERRIASRLADIEAAAIRAIRSGTGAIATVGATAPFVGLFGTVWGIMNSFIGISKAQTTNLAVVAPGIAEALLATAIGLVAAIPAVILYNQLARATATYKVRVRETTALVLRLASRDLGRRLPTVERKA